MFTFARMFAVAVCSLVFGAALFATVAPPSAGAQTEPPVVSGRIISGSVPVTGGFGLIVFGGGTYEELVTASGCPAARAAFWATQDGSFIVYVPGTTVGAVNVPFEGAFPNRMIPMSTPLVGRCIPMTGVDPRNATYEVEGSPVTLVNGISEVEAAPGSASKITTRFFGNEAVSDLDGNGVPDVGFVLTQSGGGSGTFYYAVAALLTPAGYVGTNAVLLGDRIAPQTTEIRDRTLIVNYADRKPGEAFTVTPSVGVSTYLTLIGGRLVEEDLAASSWRLATIAGTGVLAGTEITVDFGDGRVSGSSGCNSYSGGYEANEDAITVDQALASTLRACEVHVMDQESAYLAALVAAERFSIAENTLTIQTGTGEPVFTRLAG